MPNDNFDTSNRHFELWCSPKQHWRKRAGNYRVLQHVGRRCNDLDKEFGKWHHTLYYLIAAAASYLNEERVVDGSFVAAAAVVWTRWPPPQFSSLMQNRVWFHAEPRVTVLYRERERETSTRLILQCAFLVCVRLTCGSIRKKILATFFFCFFASSR